MWPTERTARVDTAFRISGSLDRRRMNQAPNSVTQHAAAVVTVRQCRTISAEPATGKRLSDLDAERETAEWVGPSERYFFSVAELARRAVCPTPWLGKWIVTAFKAVSPSSNPVPCIKTIRCVFGCMDEDAAFLKTLIIFSIIEMLQPLSLTLKIIRQYI